MYNKFKLYSYFSESVQVKKKAQFCNIGADSIAQQARHWNYMFSTGRKGQLSPIGADVSTKFVICPQGPMFSQWPQSLTVFFPRTLWKFSREALRPGSQSFKTLEGTFPSYMLSNIYLLFRFYIYYIYGLLYFKIIYYIFIIYSLII